MNYAMNLILVVASALLLSNGARAEEAPNAATGIVRSTDASRLSIETRRGEVLSIDSADALVHHMVAPGIKIGSAVFVTGVRSGSQLHATSVAHAKPAPASWAPER